MSKLKGLLFDVDGTLLDTEELHRQAFNQAFLNFDLGWEWRPQAYGELLAVSGGPARIARYLDEIDMPAAEKTHLRRIIPAIHDEKTIIYRRLIGSSAAQLRPGVARLIEEARAAGVTVGLVATSTWASVQTLLEAAFDATTRAGFKSIVCVEQVARRKPAPDVYESLLTVLRLPAEAAVAFEDSANGVTAAKLARLFTIATPTRWTALQNFDAADLILPHLGDPAVPLDAAAAAKAGGSPYLSLAHLEAMHSHADGSKKLRNLG